MDNTFINEELDEFLDRLIEDEEGEEGDDTRKSNHYDGRWRGRVKPLDNSAAQKRAIWANRRRRERGESGDWREFAHGGKKTASQKAKSKAKAGAKKDKQTAEYEKLVPRPEGMSRRVWLQRVRRKQASIAKAKAAKKSAKNESFDLDDFLNEIINC